MKYISFTLRVTIVILALTPLFSSVTQAAITKCKKKSDCKAFCKNSNGNCHEGGLCRCYDAGGDKIVPPQLKGNGGKCTEVMTLGADCMRACDAGETTVLKNPIAYTCEGSKFCFCEFDIAKGVVTKCEKDDEYDKAGICKPKNNKKESQFCEKNDVTCEGFQTCSCEKGEVLDTKECVKESYCNGVCKDGLSMRGKLCNAADGNKVCVCGGEVPDN